MKSIGLIAIPFFVALFAWSCEQRDNPPQSERIVHHGFALDVRSGQPDFAAHWSSILLRIEDGTRIHAALPSWADTPSLQELIMALRLHPGCQAQIVFDSSGLACQPGLLDSVLEWHQAELLQCANLGEEGKSKSFQVKDGMIVFEDLKALPGDDGAYLLAFLEFAETGGGRSIASIHGDQGFSEAAMERIAVLSEGGNNKHLVGTRILTDQYEHQLYYYPRSFSHNPLDSLLTQLEAGLQSLPRPSKLRVFSRNGIDSALQVRLGGLIAQYDLDLKILLAPLSDADGRAHAVSLDSSLFRVASQGTWFPEVALLDGPMKNGSIGTATRRHAVLFGGLGCLRPIPPGTHGILTQVNARPFFDRVNADWTRLWNLGQELPQAVDLLKGKSPMDF